LGDPKAAHLVYVDESGMDERDDYGYGWSRSGERFYGLKSGRRQGRVNMIAGYRAGQLIAPFTVEGACNRTVFEIWLETCLIPVLKPGESVIVDNATFDHGGRIAQLIEAAGAQVVYLPPYSPDLNRPIEMLGVVEKSNSQTVTSFRQFARCHECRSQTGGVLTSLAIAITSRYASTEDLRLLAIGTPR